jgi:hypothetical protein
MNKNECSLIQNNQLLLDHLPEELKSLPYGIYPDNTLYNNSRFIYNKRFNYFPIAIFNVNNENDIIYLIQTFVKLILCKLILCKLYLDIFLNFLYIYIYIYILYFDTYHEKSHNLW